MNESLPFIFSLASSELSLDAVGGKSRTLSHLAAAGLPVPSGLLISTRAYRDFVAVNDLQARILELSHHARDSAKAAHTASCTIRDLFETAALPNEIEAAIGHAAAPFGCAPLAVRSSANAEDLPDLSFAGLQDSFLNVRGESALLLAVRHCWASLWSERAIVYRDRMGIAQETVAMGVLVQTMIDADVSGILFTANPTTGARNEIVVNASFGLGEAIVGGEVTPDTYLLDRDSLTPVQVITGAKTTMIVPDGSRGTRSQAVPESSRSQNALNGEQLRDLASLGLRAESECGGTPQDIEWAIDGEQYWLLQSRPITGLPAEQPDATWSSPYGNAKLVRRQVVENMPEPLSPLFEALYLNEGLDRGIDLLVEEMGLPLNIDEFITRPLFVTINGFGYCRYDFHITRRTLAMIPRILYYYVRSLPPLIGNLVPMWRESGLPDYQQTIARHRLLDHKAASDDALLGAVTELAMADARYWFYISMMVGVAKITEGLLHRFVTSRAVRGTLTSAMFLRGFPSQTLEAQRSLTAIASNLSTNPALRDLADGEPVEEMVERLRQHPDGQRIAADITNHLKSYGHQVYNLDFVVPTQAENPAPVLLGLWALLSDEDPLGTWRERQATLVRERETLEAQTTASLGPVRRAIFQKLLSWGQRFGPNREEALFYMGAAWPELRRCALELGARLTASGTLATPSDLFFLRPEEIEEACTAREGSTARPNLRELAASRRTLREARKKLHPPARVPENLRFKLGPLDFTRFFEVWETQKLNPDEGDVLRGFAVSPGTVTGIASVVLSPEDFTDMRPNTILVCPTTTPAWTPMFNHALALVTDIGAILAHGSIVAREFGIPAVLGTGNATVRIATGQRITVDGSAGTVTLVD